MVSRFGCLFFGASEPLHCGRGAGGGKGGEGYAIGEWEDSNFLSFCFYFFVK